MTPTPSKIPKTPKYFPNSVQKTSKSPSSHIPPAARFFTFLAEFAKYFGVLGIFDVYGSFCERNVRFCRKKSQIEQHDCSLLSTNKKLLFEQSIINYQVLNTT
jgi:hypothetical protein